MEGELDRMKDETGFNTLDTISGAGRFNEWMAATLMPWCRGEILEIGFGFGDFLFENAKRNPDIQFIGCEPHLNGVVNLLAKLEKENLDNYWSASEDGIWNMTLDFRSTRIKMLKMLTDNIYDDTLIFEK